MLPYRHHPEIAGIVPDSGSVPIGRPVAIHSDVTYADPNLMLLLCLFGFCLLYALVLVGDALAARRGAVPEARTDPESGTAGGDVRK